VSDTRVALVVGLLTAQLLVSGALFVLLVPVAFETLGTGEAGFGGLLGALGVGGLVGAATALALVGRRLSTALAVAIVLWGAPIALLALFDTHAAALVLVGVIGFANTVGDVAGFTLLQRAVPEEVLARVFAILESLFYGATALGAILAPLAIAGLGLRGALVATGLLLPALVALSWRHVRSIDAGAWRLRLPWGRWRL